MGLLALVIVLISAVHCEEDIEDIKLALRNLLFVRADAEKCAMEPSLFQENQRDNVLAKLNNAATNNNKDTDRDVPLKWDKLLAQRAHDLADSCAWVAKKDVGCNGEEVGVISGWVGNVNKEEYRSNIDSHLNTFVDDFYTESAKWAKKGRDGGD